MAFGYNSFVHLASDYSLGRNLYQTGAHMIWMFVKRFVKVIPGMAARWQILGFVLWALACAAWPGRAQSKPNQAGEIRFVVPVGNVLRGTAPAIPAERNDPLYWQDTVRTESGGRIRIGLLDGSILNVGSQSSLTITQHDPATQQTQLELTYGRIPAKAVHIVKPGGRFKVLTTVAGIAALRD